MNNKKNKLKILYLVNADWYFCLHWIDRAKYFIDRGYEIHVASPITSEDEVKKISEAGIFFHPLGLSRANISPLSLIQEFLRFNKIIKTIKPDLINSITVKPNVLGGLCSIMHKIPVVCAVTGLGVSFSKESLKSKLSRFFIVKAYNVIAKYNSSSKFIFENDVDLELIQRESRLTNDQTVRVYGAGVDAQLFSKTDRLDNPTLKLFFASRLLKSKGIMFLVEAIEALNKNDCSVTLDIAGIEDLSSDDALLASDMFKLKNTNNVNFLGRVDNVNELISKYDLVCLPTFYGEGIPRILIEAAASGRAILATNTGGMCEICINGFNGYVVKPKSVSSIIEAIKKYQENRCLLTKHGEMGRQLFEKKFTNEAVFSVFSKVYESLILDN